MSKLTEAEVLTRGAGRDLNAELLEAVADMQAFEKNLVITDGEQFSLDVNEFGGSS
jgi:hypothetical protein